MPAHTPKLDQAHALLYHARAAPPFSSLVVEAFASVPAGLDSRPVLPLRTATFREWLITNTALAPSPGWPPPFALAVRIRYWSLLVSPGVASLCLGTPFVR